MAQDTLLGFPAHTLPYRCTGACQLCFCIFVRKREALVVSCLFIEAEDSF